MADVLLAEDEPVSRRFLHDALQTLGLRCDSVADGAAAVARARSARYALLLFDRALPGLRGDEALRRIRGEPDSASRAAPAIALTADPDPAMHRTLLAAGFAAVGCKPLGLDALRALLAPWLPGTQAGWDDVAGLSATGDPIVLRRLRDLMLAELPAQAREVAQAAKRGDEAAARAVLHRLRAACGFCGAAGLGQRVDALHAALGGPHVDALAAFEREVAALLARGAD